MSTDFDLDKWPNAFNGGAWMGAAGRTCTRLARDRSVVDLRKPGSAAFHAASGATGPVSMPARCRRSRKVQPQRATEDSIGAHGNGIVRLASRSCCEGRRAVRSATGAAQIAEFAAALCVFLPIALCVALAAYEASMVLMVHGALDHCAHSAAIVLSRAYASDTSVATNQSSQQQYLKTITFTNIVISPSQFQVKFPPAPDTASWSTNGNAPLVYVTCSFTGGQYGLPAFPSFDPLHLLQGYTVTGSGEAYLE